MIIGSLKEVFLTSAKDAYLFDCRVAGLGSDILSGYQEVLETFIRFTGDIQVKQLTPDLLRMYILNLSDGPSEGEEHDDLVLSHDAVLQTWIHWMYVQKFVHERDGTTVKPPTSASLIPSRITYSLAHYWKYPLSL